MAARRAQAVGAALLVIASLAPAAGGAATAGSLTVTGYWWQVVGLPGDESTGRSIFQAPGDLNGDGADDLIVWRGSNASQTGFVLYNGSPSGLDLSRPRTAPVGYGVPGSFRDTGNPLSWDARPSGVDIDGDGADEMAGAYDAPMACPEDPAAFCLAVETHFDAVAFGSAVKPLNRSEEVFGPDPSGAIVAHHEGVYLLGPLRPGSSAAALGERVTARDQAPGGVAFTTFTVVEFVGTSRSQRSWVLEEPLPLASVARPPRFLAAPDFDADGLADLVVWSPPGGTASGTARGLLTVVNGSSTGPDTDAPLRLALDFPNLAIGDIDGDGHPDIVGYRAAVGGAPPVPYLDVAVGYWDARGLFYNPDSVRLTGPSIFASQPPAKLQAGDLDGDGRADLVAVKYDTTSASTGHLLVDAFLGVPSCGHGPGGVCDAALAAEPSFSSELSLTGSDIYAGPDGVRVNLASDFDGDAILDVAVGFFGGNAPERGRTSTSGFVAVLSGSTLLRTVYGVWLETDPGLTVHPAYRNYTLAGHVLTTLETGAFRVNFTGLPGSPYIEFEGPFTARSFDDAQLAIDGPAYFSHGDTLNGALWMFSVPVRFNWSFPSGAFFGLEAGWLGGLASERAVNPRAGRLIAGTAIEGDLRMEWAGASVEPGGWVAAGAVVNISNVTLDFAGSGNVAVPPAAYAWHLVDGSGAVIAGAAGGDFEAAVTAPPVTWRDLTFAVTITGAAAFVGAPRLNFTLNVDGDMPKFGAHLPLESEWATSRPTFVAAAIFDNESGVDPARIEYSWENDGAPFVLWSRATALPGQSAAEVVASAYVDFPEGNLSNIIWRAWDKVGNGPSVSPIFGVKIDTHDVTFEDPQPPSDEWQNGSWVSTSIGIRAGASGLNNSSIAYRVSTAGPFAFGPWRTDCQQHPDPERPNWTITCAVLLGPDGVRRDLWWVDLADGDANWVQWRAENNAGGGLRLSDPHQVRVDTRGPVISAVWPDATVVHPLAPVKLTVAAHEGSPRELAQRGLDTSAAGATYRVREPGTTEFGPPLPMSPFEPSADGWQSSFTAVGDFARGSWLVEFTVRERGGRAATATTTVRINEIPTVNVSSAPAGFTVVVGGTLSVTAVGSDPEGGPLSFQWTTCKPREPPLSGNATLVFSGRAPVEALRTGAARNVTLCLTVRDPVDGVARSNVAVSIVDELPRPPGPSAPDVVTQTADAGTLAALLLAAVAVTILALALARRRRPPDNV